jgi:phosphatidylserine decarboxylase
MSVFGGALAVLLISGGCTLWFVGEPAIRYTLLGIVVVLGALVVNFFRDPERRTPPADHAVICPADGKVVQIKEIFEPEFLGQEAVQVSIFMSPLNVHVNRFPISGTIRYFEHIHGDYLVAFDEKSSERNERTLIGIEREDFKVLMKQIAGAVARRIVAPVKVGQRAVAGERFGMIRFGSRVDLLLPSSASVTVGLNERVVAGETVIARYSPRPRA